MHSGEQVARDEMKGRETAMATPKMNSLLSTPAPAARTTPLYLLVITWLTIPILILMTVRGGFSFQETGSQVTWQRSIVSTASEQDTMRSRIQEIAIYPMMLIFMFPYWRRVMSLYREHTIFALITIEAFFSVIWSQFPLRTMLVSTYLVISFCFAHAFLLRFKKEDQLRLLYWTGWCITLGSLAVVFLLPHYGISGMGGGEWKGLFSQKNVLARACVFLLSPVFFIKSTSGLDQFFKAAYCLLVMLLIFKSASATGMVIVVIMALFVISLRWFSRADKKEAWLSILLVTAIGSSIVLLAWQFWSSLSTLLGKSATLTGRTDIWAAVFTALMKRPVLGYGLGGFWWGMKGEAGNIGLTVGWAVGHSHNGFLDVWVDLGIVGLVLIIASLIKAIRDALFVIRVENTLYAQWCLSIVVLTVLYNLDEVTFLLHGQLVWLMYTLACIALSLDANRLHHKASVLSQTQR